MYQDIKSQVQISRKEEMVSLIIGDFNCKIGNEIEGNTKETSKGGRLMNKLIEDEKLKIINSTEKCKGLWTRTEGDKKSVLDYVIVSSEHEEKVEEMIIDEEKEIAFYRHAEEKGIGEVIYSDHNTIKLRLKLKANVKERKDKEEDMWKVKIMKEKECKEFEEATREMSELNVIWKREDRTLQEKFTEWSEVILKLKKNIMRKRKTKRTEGTTKEINKLRKQKKKIKRQMRKNKEKEENRILKMHVKLLNKHIGTREREEKGKNQKKIIEEISKHGGIKNGGFWNVRKKLEPKKIEPVCTIKNSEGKMIKEENEIKREYQNFYQNLLKVKKTESSIEEKVEKVVDQIIKLGERDKVKIIDEEEMDKVIKELKLGKASDIQGWCNEMLKWGGEDMKKSLRSMLNEVLKTKCIPTEWEKFKIKSIYKNKGSRHELKNRRGIFITSVLSKVMEKILLNRNNQAIDKGITESQCGGKKKRGISDLLFTMYRLIEHNRYLGDETNIVFIDAEKCFDKLWLKDCLISLWEKGMNASDVALLYQLNKKAEGCVETPVGITESFVLQEIVKQGTVWGPKMCCAETDDINKYGTHKATSLGNVMIDCRVFVDDMASIGSNKIVESFVNIGCKQFEKCKKFSFSIEKSKVMKINKNKSKKEVTTDKLKITKGGLEESKKYKYLGDIIQEDGKKTEEVESRGIKVKKITEQIMKWTAYESVGDMALELRLMLLEVIIIPITIFNTETWGK